MTFQTEQLTHPKPLLHAFTVDLEDWYQSTIDTSAPITERVIRNTHILLDFLDEFGVKATFFTQGKVAETFPNLIREIQELGHEIQSHGYSHIPLHLLDVSSFHEDLNRSIKILEEITGQPVTAFRAPDFSITEQNLWALDVLAESGIQVDSSIFPMKTWHYGISNTPLQPYELNTPQGKALLEVPVAIWALKTRRVPISGGGYLRLLPYSVIRRGMQVIEKIGRPAVIYCHPYEFRAEEINEYTNQVNPFYAMYQKLGREALVRRLRRLLKEFKFGRLDQCLERWYAQSKTPIIR
jgi:polysaccharide deacetylase family protein (PEP-CTERM system associated)